MSEDPYYRNCARREALDDHVCIPDPLTNKLLDWEHAIIFAGRQLNEKWAILPICWLVHRGGKLNKEINVWLCLNRATDEELRAVSKSTDYIRMRSTLNEKYGIPHRTTGPGEDLDEQDLQWSPLD